jgi:flagella basal body P-ring formation protein FlgA
MILRAADVEMRRVSTKELRRDTLPRITRLEEIVGLETTRPIQSGQVLSRQMVRQPIVVRRGDSVTVFARAAGIQVRTIGQARENGGRGDLVVVETIEDRQRFTARVVGLREVEVLAQGVDAANYAPRRREAAPARTRRPEHNPRVADAEPFGRNASPRNEQTTTASPPPGADDTQDDSATPPRRADDEAARSGGLQWQAAKRLRSTDR